MCCVKVCCEVYIPSCDSVSVGEPASPPVAMSSLHGGGRCQVHVQRDDPEK